MTNIDIKKLFVKVNVADDAIAQAWKNAEEGSHLDSSKIYFLSDGTIYTNGKYYGTKDGVLDALSNAITTEKNRAEGVEDALKGRLDVIEGEGDGSIKKAVNDAIDRIMGGDNINEALDTLKEIAEWINGEDADDGIQSFLSHVTEFKSTVGNYTGKDFEGNDATLEDGVTPVAASGLRKDIEDAKNSADAKLAAFAGTEDGSFPKFESSDDRAPELAKDYINNMSEYIAYVDKRDDAHEDRLTANANAITAEEGARKAAIEAMEFDETASHGITSTITKPDGSEEKVSTSVSVSLKQVNGKITDLIVVTSDIASAKALSNLQTQHSADVTNHNTDIQKLNRYDSNLDARIGKPTDTADAKAEIVNIESGNTVVGTDIPTVWSQIKRLDAKVESSIDSLDVAETTVTGNSGSGNVHVTYSETDGKVSIDSVVEDYATVTRTPLDDTTKPALTVADDSKLVKGSDVDAVARYAEDILNDKVNSLDATVSSPDKETVDYVKTTVSQTDGLLASTDVTVTYGRFATVTDAEVAGIATVEATADYVEGQVADLAVTASGDDYVSADVDADVDNKKVVVTTNVADVTFSEGTRGTWAVDDDGVATLADEVAPSIYGTSKTLMDAAQAIDAVKTYVDAKVAIEAAERTARIDSAVKSLDSSKTLDETKENGEGKIGVAINITDGKLTDAFVSATYANYVPSTTGAGSVSEGIVDTKTLKAALEDLWETFSEAGLSTGDTDATA